MDFYTYMLRCSDGSYYTGHTEDLNVRIAQHERGTLPGYTHDRRPVTLVWCEVFATRDEALAAERRIKGWSRAKKEALIAGDRDRVSMLARNRQGGGPSTALRTGPSTGSGRTGGSEGSSIQTTLTRHPDSHTKAVRHVNASVERKRKTLDLTYVIEGTTERLQIPAPAKPYRTDGLWRSTCVELFVRGPRGEYYEFNFAPSTEWAAYRFSGRREGMEPLELDTPPRISVSDEGAALIVSVQLEGLGDGPLTVGLSAVVAEKDGTLSYWALKHPPGAADFHDPACFTLELPAAV